MFYGLSTIDLVLPLTTLIAIFIVLFNDKLPKNLSVNNNHLKLALLIVILGLFPLIGIKIGIIKYAIDLSLLAFCVFVFFIGFLIDRKYIYISAIIFLIFAAIINTIGTSKLAEYFAVLCYLLLVLGVFKDLFYEKFFKID